MDVEAITRVVAVSTDQADWGAACCESEYVQLTAKQASELNGYGTRLAEIAKRLEELKPGEGEPVPIRGREQ